MNIIVTIGVFVLALAFEYLAERLFHCEFFRSHGFISKLMAAFLAGFITFILLIDNIPGTGQRGSAILAALLLIYANLFLGKKEDEQ
ncbi:MAG: hypothetical protein NT166_24850 [Candidatus Aminicenantes bacterium]|nr:hypothetical protein [Candidatus Aminicenantes bacterium]